MLSERVELTTVKAVDAGAEVATIAVINRSVATYVSSHSCWFWQCHIRR